MLSKYTIQSKSSKEVAVLGYNAEAMLVYFSLNENLTQEQIKWFVNNFPLYENELPAIEKRAKGSLTITRAQTDLSFPAIWEAYAYKVGKKAKAEAKWNKLSEAEKLAVFNCLPIYNAHLQAKGTAKAYLETFLNNNYWENEFK